VHLLAVHFDVGVKIHSFHQMAVTATSIVEKHNKVISYFSKLHNLEILAAVRTENTFIIYVSMGLRITSNKPMSTVIALYSTWTTAITKMKM
jgi:hypothetical protein